LDIFHAYENIIKPFNFTSSKLKQSQPIDLISANLVCNSSRHLMLITPENEESEAISFVE
jgi:hypothetical protein